jgi:plasmid stabilization system protein ParE
MNKTWRFHPDVASELEDAARWYEKQRAGLGIDFALTVLSVIDTLQAMPTLGSPLVDMPTKETVRRIFLPRFQHAVVFVERPDEYFVVGVPHLRREPGYWLKRLDE